MVEVLKDLVRKRWITKCRSVTDTRVVHLLLSRRGQALALQIKQWLRQVKARLAEQDRRALDMSLKRHRA
jgi:DNA-binding MarR family transcriptional regulator